MKLLTTGSKDDLKNLLFALKYENMIREVIIYSPEGEINDPFFESYRVLVSEAEVKLFFESESAIFIVSEESSIKRKELHLKLMKLGGFPISFFSSQSLISRFNQISNHGVLIQVHCDISADTILHDGVLIGMQSLIGHDVQIGAFTTIGIKSCLLGYVKIGESCQIEHGVTIMPNVNIGNNVYISSNQTITKDIPDNIRI